MLSLKYIITEEVTCVDAAEIMKCFEKWGGGGGQNLWHLAHRKFREKKGYF